MNRKRTICLIFLIAILSLCGCGSGTEMQDGFYTAEMSDYSHGWKEYVCIMVKNDQIVYVEFNAKDPSGYIKAWDNAYMENMVMGIAFGTAVTIFKKNYLKGFKGTYHQIKFKDISQKDSPKSLPITGNRFNQISQDEFTKIPGQPISYWVSENLIHDFVIGKRMDEVVTPKQGLATADNNRFLREWWEVEHDKIKFDAKSIPDAVESGKKWFPYNKGGSFRRWYGNYDYVVNWENDGQEIRNFVDDKGKLRSRPQNTEYYFKEAITWPLITSGGLSVRYREYGSIHDVSGMSAFSDNVDVIYYIIGMLNTPLGNNILRILNPTINSQIGDFRNIPVIVNQKYEIINFVQQAILLTKEDWDLNENTWNFKISPLI